jgi:hypothetical protein
MKLKYNIYTILLVIIIIFEILFLLFNDNEIFKEHIDGIYTDGDKTIKKFTIVLVLILCFLLYYFANFIEMTLKINKYIVIAFIVFSLIIFIEYKLSRNVSFSKTENELEEALKKANTGDFLLFRSYHTFDIPELFFFRYFNCMLSEQFFGHVGIIIKKDGIPYIFESTEDYYDCEHSGFNKNGVIFHKAYDRLKDYSGRVYLSRNNLNNYINDEDVSNFIKNHGHLTFLQNNYGCCRIIIDLLHSCGVFQNKHFFIFPCDFNKEKYYKIKYENIENIKLRNDFVIKNGK